MPDNEPDPPLPVPDPTRLSTEALTRGLKNERDYVDGQIGILTERLRGIDKATELLSATVNRVPTDLQKAVADLKELMNERDRRIQDQFEAIRRLRESESALNQTALQAALATSKEATAVSAASLDRTIEKNAQLATQAVASVEARVTQLSDSVIVSQKSIAEILASRQAVVEQKTDTRGGAGMIFGIVGAVVGLLGFILAAILAATRL